MPYEPCYKVSACPSLAEASAAAAAGAAPPAAAVRNDLALRRTLSRKNAEICELSAKYRRDLAELEAQLSATRLDNCGLKSRLEAAGKDLSSERCRKEQLSAQKNAELADLKAQLRAAEQEIATLDPRAKLACELEKKVRKLLHVCLEL